MDFEFAMWQMLYLFVAPQKVYRNFGYRKGLSSIFVILMIHCYRPYYFQKPNHSLLETIPRFSFFC
jgi:UNC-50 family